MLAILLVTGLVVFSGIELFGSGIRDTYYPSNDMDPYLQNKGVSKIFELYLI